MQTIEQNKTSKFNWELEGNFLLNNQSRERALEIIANTPFPSTKDEAWKYTRVAKIKNTAFVCGKTSNVDFSLGLTASSLKLVFVNGHFSKELSSKEFPDGIKVCALSEMDPQEISVFGTELKLENELFNAINTAYTTDGAYLHVSAKINIDTPIELIYVHTGECVISNIRNVIAVESMSNLKVVQQFISTSKGANFTNSVSEIRVAKNAQLTIDKIQEESEFDYHIATDEVTQADDSTFTINTITLNGGLVRNNLNIRVAGKNCISNLNGAYILDGNQHVDNHTIVDHLVAHCESHELYKGVINGNGTAVFNGKVFVRKDAQKINAFQSNANVLLSDNATINSKPELEIYADDVKCSHGSTTGQLDEEAVFYLRARGISEKNAKQLMVGAFIADVLAKIENEAVLARIQDVIHSRFGWEFN
jgi:Fe-S cluster assembly protein SufD